MNIKSTIAAFTFLAILALGAPSVQAGSQQNAPILHKPNDIAEFAKGVEKYAASHGARAFIIARMGRPAKDLPTGINYTHTAIAIYSAITLANGDIVNGYVIHNLYQDADNKKQSSLISDYPVDFFWGAQELKAGIIIPTAQIQQELIALIARGDNKKLHNPKYTVLANPYNSMYQNCTEYTLDLINAAIYKTNNIKQLKANANAHFNAQVIKTSRFKLMLGSALMEDVTTRDHKGKVRTATFTSIAKYLQQYDLATQAVALNENLIAVNI